jgi:hypothetical protein
MRAVQVRESAAICETMLIHSTGIAIQESARNSIHHHMTLLAGFYVPGFKLGLRCTEIICYWCKFTFFNIDHKRTATVSARETVDTRRNFIIQAVNNQINLFGSTSLQVAFELFIFFVLFCSLLLNDSYVVLQLKCSRSNVFRVAKLMYCSL